MSESLGKSCQSFRLYTVFLFCHNKRLFNFLVAKLRKILHTIAISNEKNNQAETARLIESGDGSLIRYNPLKTNQRVP